MDTVHFISDNPDLNETQIELNKESIQKFSAEDIKNVLTRIEKIWYLDRQGDRAVPIQCGYSQFYNSDELSADGLPKDTMFPNQETLQTRLNLKRFTYHELMSRAEILGVKDEITEDVNGTEFTISKRFQRIYDTLFQSYETIRLYVLMCDRVNNPTMDSKISSWEQLVFNMNPENDMDDLSSYQELLYTLMKNIKRVGYRRYNDQCCSEIITPAGHHTRAWKAVKSISDFVQETCSLSVENNKHLWKLSTEKASYSKDAIRYLSVCKEMDFPDIKKNRHVWSFKNGLFVGKEWDIKTGQYVCKFYNYDSPMFGCLDPTVVSSKYFDLQFETHDHVEDWWDIPTPHFQNILNYQELDEDVSKWLYVMGGRLCFEVGDMDLWQVIPFLKGIAGSGKSTIITNVYKLFYENEDVKTLSNNIERKFGLSSICGGKMFIAPEVKGDLCLEQAEFQSLVSGEDVSIARKYENARSLKWDVPGILGGNEVPNWRDNSGSVLRRILTWNFGIVVQDKDKDPNMSQKLDKEIPAILLKCIRGYLDYAQKHKDKDIWSIVPSYFKGVQNQVAMVTNSLRHFLSSEKINYSEDLKVPQKIFVQIFNQHCTENNLGKSRFNQDLYAAPFSARRLKVTTEAITYKGRAFPNQPVIHGVDVVDDSLQISDDY